jgi:hypothetical protein
MRQNVLQTAHVLYTTEPLTIQILDAYQRLFDVSLGGMGMGLQQKLGGLGDVSSVSLDVLLGQPCVLSVLGCFGA